MAGHKLASVVLVDHAASLFRHNVAQSFSIPPLPPHCLDRATGAAAPKPEHVRVPSRPPSVSRELSSIQHKASSPCKRAVYLVNPSRHAPEYRLIHKHSRLLKDAVLSPYLSSTAIAPRTLTPSSRAREVMPLLQDPKTLASVSMPYRRTSVMMEHLASMKQPTPISHDAIPVHVLPVPIPQSSGTTLGHAQWDSTPLCYFSPTPSPSPSPLDRPTPAQMSFILLKLREELPAFFEGHHSFSIYSPDMRFECSLRRFSWKVRGCSTYAALLSTYRLSLQVCFSQTKLDLLKITKELEQGKIEARWRVRGSPRFLWRAEERIILEGFSTFTVNSSGLISIHKIDRVMPAKKERGRVMTWLAQVGVALRLTPPLPQPSMEPGVT